LLEETVKLGFLLHAYCVMPDHIHFLVHGREVNSNFLRRMKESKSRTAFLFHVNYGRYLWEMSFYEHILRKAEDVEPVAYYIWNNPVRMRLSAQPQEYAFSGSQTIDWMISAQRGRGFVPPWKAMWSI